MAWTTSNHDATYRHETRKFKNGCLGEDKRLLFYARTAKTGNKKLQLALYDF